MNIKKLNFPKKTFWVCKKFAFLHLDWENEWILKEKIKGISLRTTFLLKILFKIIWILMNNCTMYKISSTSDKISKNIRPHSSSPSLAMIYNFHSAPHHWTLITISQDCFSISVRTFIVLYWHSYKCKYILLFLLL